MRVAPGAGMAAAWLLCAAAMLAAPVPPDCGPANDCTKAIMTALDAAGAAGGGVVTLAPRPGNKPWVVAEHGAPPLNNHALMVGSAHANVRLELQPGVVIQAQRGAFKPAACYLLLIQNASNFSVVGYGAKIQMWVADYNDTSKYVASEDRHGISIAGSTNVSIEGLTVDGSGGGNPKRVLFASASRPQEAAVQTASSSAAASVARASRRATRASSKGSTRSPTTQQSATACSPATDARA